MTITATQFLLLLEPGLRNIWHESWPPRELQFVDVFNIGDMAKATETDAKMGGFGALNEQAEGESIIFQDPLTPITREYTYRVFASGYRITDRMVRDELYGQAERFERDLMSAVRDNQEIQAWDLLNNGFATTNNTGFDGLSLFSTAHTRLDGGANQANRPATDAALSLSVLHDAIIQFRNWVNERGRPFQANPKLLIVAPEDMMVADELLNSNLKPGTANNDLNAVTRFGLSFKVVDYLTSTTAWFLIGDNHDMNYLWRFRPESGSEVDFDTDIIKRKVRQGYATGFGEWRGTYGTTGV